MSRVVQLTLTMNPEGQIVAEIPFNGGRRHILIDSFESIRRILAAQLHRSQSTIGTDGAPTQSQVIHWERHLEGADYSDNASVKDSKRERMDTSGAVIRVNNLDPDNCIWCLAHTMGLATDRRAHNRARAILREQRKAASRPFSMGDGSVKVRHIPAQDKHIRSSSTPKHEVIDHGDISLDLSELGI